MRYMGVCVLGNNKSLILFRENPLLFIRAMHDRTSIVTKLLEFCTKTSSSSFVAKKTSGCRTDSRFCGRTSQRNQKRDNSNAHSKKFDTVTVIKEKRRASQETFMSHPNESNKRDFVFERREKRCTHTRARR